MGLGRDVRSDGQSIASNGRDAEELSGHNSVYTCRSVGSTQAPSKGVRSETTTAPESYSSLRSSTVSGGGSDAIRHHYD